MCWLTEGDSPDGQSGLPAAVATEGGACFLGPADPSSVKELQEEVTWGKSASAGCTPCAMRSPAFSLWRPLGLRAGHGASPPSPPLELSGSGSALGLVAGGI